MKNVELVGKDYAMEVRKSLKEECRHMGLILPGSAIAVVNFEKREILLQRRTDNNTIGMLGGGMGTLESFEECAVREIFEESGLKSFKEDFELFKIYKGKEFITIHPNGDEVIHIIWTSILDYTKTSGELISSNEETKELVWVSYKDVPGLELFPAHRPILKEIVEFLSK